VVLVEACPAKTWIVCISTFWSVKLVKQECLNEWKLNLVSIYFLIIRLQDVDEYFGEFWPLNKYSLGLYCFPTDPSAK
jgi:hypothetical protein